MTERFRIGVISSVHGIRGEAKVFVTSDDPARFKKLKTVHAVSGTRELLLNVEHVKLLNGMAIVKFAGIDTPEDIRKYRNMELYVDREDAVPLSEGEFYIADLIGLKVVTDGDETIGTVKELFPTGANHVLTVAKPDGEELLIPYIKDCILAVCPEEGFIRVHLLEGL